MVIRKLLGFTSVLLALIAGTTAQAQHGPAAGRVYDAKTVETLSGEIVSVERVPHAERSAHGIHLTLHTKDEKLAVHLGPSWYVDKQEVKLAVKDVVTVRGSRVKIDGKAVMIAAEVRKGEMALKLRDPNGRPLWAGGRGR